MPIWLYFLSLKWLILACNYHSGDTNNQNIAFIVKCQTVTNSVPTITFKMVLLFHYYIFIHLIPVFIIHIQVHMIFIYWYRAYDSLIEYTTKIAICWIAYQNLDIIELIVNTFFLNRLNTTLLTFASWCGICFYPNIPFMYVAICYFSLLLHLAQTK